MTWPFQTSVSLPHSEEGTSRKSSELQELDEKQISVVSDKDRSTAVLLCPRRGPLQVTGHHTARQDHSLPMAMETSIGTAPASGSASAVPASAPASRVAS